MREIPGTAESPSPDGISTGSATQSSPRQVWTKRRRERSAAGDLADIRSNPGRLVGIGVGLDTRSNRRNKGTSGTGREVPAAGLSDSRGSIDGLASIDASIGRLVSQ
jgi:hypothetical protein